MRKVWRFAPTVGRVAVELKTPLPALAATLLANRGIIEAAAVEEFLFPDYIRHLYDPLLFTDMKVVIERIALALAKTEPLVIYGDYDADGVCSVAVLTSTLQVLGANVIEVYLPHREKEGYGLNRAAVERLVGIGTRLIITLDCGTTNIDEIRYAQSQGVDVIVIDHHNTADELPGAFAFLNPKRPGEKYPYRHLASVGLAFKTAQALLRYHIVNRPDEATRWKQFEKWLLDLVAIATVTDLVPLVGENRTLLKYGLKTLNQTRRPGLRALVSIMGGTLGRLDTYSIAYQIGPRLNAAGRMNHANAAYKLIMCEEDETAKLLATELEANNRARQALTERITAEALASLSGQEQEKVLVAVGDGWPIGLVGLVASRLQEQYHRPIIVIGRTERGLAGSGRSVAIFNIIEALYSMPELFIKFGGHAQACGFTLKDENALNDFRRRINALASVQLGADDLQPVMVIDASLNLHDVNEELYELVCLLEPYGMANPKPRFLISNVRVVGCSTVGARGQHLKLTVSDNEGAIRQAIGFNLANKTGELVQLGANVDLVAEVLLNEFNGQRELQLKVLDIRSALPS